MAKNYEIAILIDFYGEMLTAKQRDFLEYYYNDDLSLSEIAENEALPARESVTLSRGGDSAQRDGEPPRHGKEI